MRKRSRKNAVICVSCGCNLKKKAIYKKWWFWLIVVFVIVLIASAGGEGAKENSGGETSSAGISASQNSSTAKKVYEKADLRTMIEELKENALKAEKTYQNKFVEIQCVITNFDSDGSYISVEPTNADEWDFTTVTCYIKNDTQLDFLLEKSKGDVITIKGKVKSVGEILGYGINIDQVS